MSRGMFRGPGMALCLWLAASAAEAAIALPVAVDPGLPDYQPVRELSGALRSEGSSTLSILLNRWSEAFRGMYRNFTMEMTASGSGAAPPALTEGKVQLAPMSRPMAAREVEAFERKYGYKPTEVKVALDALAVFVNRDNPVRGLTLQELDAIFSSTRKRGGQPVHRWGDLGMIGEWANPPVILYGFRDTAGGYGLFREIVLLNGEFRSNMRREPGSSSIVNGVGAEPGGIGYASQFFRTRRTRLLPLAAADDSPYVEPTAEESRSGKYPLARFLSIYVNRRPGQPLDPLTAEFLFFVLSRPGQEMVAKDGDFPLSAELAAQQRAAIGR